MKIIYVGIFLSLFCGFSVFGQNPIELNDSLQNIEIDLSFLNSIKIPAVEIKKEVEQEEVIFGCGGEQPATFEGGLENFYKIVNNQMRFSATMKAGKVFIEFVIDTTGKMTEIKVAEIKIVKSLSEENDKEALRIINWISENYMWKPAKQRDKKVKVRMWIPIVFKREEKVKPNSDKVYKR
ncbi:energy transducer TonB [Bernardetia sp. OM2101]|uniref:energy transducer TonB n=1 Tax=Bernardetia sp. OM2101 TaxID=3344876 RepID=UPI0035D0FD86